METTCLIIDDDLDDQEVFLMCLEKMNAGVTCLTANSGVEALAMLSSNEDYTPHYIFLDVNMPKMNGIECLRKIRAIERLNQSRIFMYSTTSEKNVVKESKALGADDFIIKPAKILALKEKLAEIFGIVSPINPKQ
jgi:CheY-like chemotaxis protein